MILLPNLASSPSQPPYLGLPLHASQGDAQQHSDRDHTDNADVIDGVHNGCVMLLVGGTD